MKNKVEYLQACLAEELCEAGQIIGKAERFGLYDIYAKDEQKRTNLERLQDELLDVLAVATLLRREGVLLPVSVSEERVQLKRARINKYLPISKAAGLIDFTMI
jgi:NTP pyrophosphatase (non-canonical NTP hydrolase)